MPNPPIVLESKVLIRFQDCDPYQHLNNSRYLDYFLNAREDQILEAYGLDVYKLAREEKIAWVVGQSQISYIKPAFFMETVWIESQLIRFGDRSVGVEMRMLDEAKKNIKSVLWMTFVHVNLRDGSSQKHSDDLMKLFAEIYNPVTEEVFELRATTLRKLGL